MKKTAAILCAVIVFALAFTMGAKASPGPIVDDNCGRDFEHPYYGAPCPEETPAGPGPIIDIEEGGGPVFEAEPVPHWDVIQWALWLVRWV